MTSFVHYVQSRGLLLWIVLLFVLPAGALPKLPHITAKASVVYDITSGIYLFEKNGNALMYPASTVKLLTAMVILDKWDENHKISIPGSVKQIEPYKLYLKKGEVYKVGDLLNALLMRSANDVAHALAIRAYGSEKKFARMMNKKASEIGAKNFHFMNPHGLPDPEQVITAKDMALITAYARNYPLLMKIMSTKKATFPGPGKGKTILENRNKLLKENFSPRVIGKTGFTHRSGLCFIGLTDKSETPVVMVLYNTKNRWEDLKKLAKWGDQFYSIRIRENKMLLHQDKVNKVQKYLQRLGFYKGEVSGIFDIPTEAAVIRFQAANRLNIDGIMGQKTLALLYKRGGN